MNQFVGLSVHYAQPRMNLHTRAGHACVTRFTDTHTLRVRERCNISHQHIHRFTRIHTRAHASTVPLTLCCLFHPIPHIVRCSILLASIQLSNNTHAMYMRVVYIHTYKHFILACIYCVTKCVWLAGWLAESMLPQTKTFTVA